MTEKDLLKLKEYLVMSKKSLGVRKHRTLAFVAYVVSLRAVGAGVAIGILFPNPITIAALGGIAVLSNKTKPRKTLKSIKDKNKQKDTIRADLEAVESRLKELQTEQVVRRTLYPSVNPI